MKCDAFTEILGCLDKVFMTHFTHVWPYSWCHVQQALEDELTVEAWPLHQSRCEMDFTRIVNRTKDDATSCFLQMTLPMWGWVGAHRFGSVRHHDHRFGDSQECSSAWSSNSGVMAAKSASSSFLWCAVSQLSCLQCSLYFKDPPPQRHTLSLCFWLTWHAMTQWRKPLRWHDMQFFFSAYSTYSTAGSTVVLCHAGSMMTVRQTPKRPRRLM